MSDRPDQSRIWEAYGHAMGAALGLELVMRLALFKSRATKLFLRGEASQGFAAKRQRIIRSMTEGTFGQIAGQFSEAFPEIRSDLFDEALGNAVDFRNNLGHRFLIHHLWDLESERGLDIISTECMLYLDHFQRLEDYIRSQADIDWDGLHASMSFKPGDPPHPLADWFEEAQDDWTPISEPNRT